MCVCVCVCECVCAFMCTIARVRVGGFYRCSIMAFFKCLQVVLSVEKDGQIRYEPRGGTRMSGILLAGGSFWFSVERAIY